MDGIRWTAAACLFIVVACANPAELPPEAARNADDLLIVDCLLPGQVRKMGSNLTYMTPRRPVKTSAVDCEIRGGEYVAFDRASYGDALRIWLPKAKEGDAQAQTYVGEIFEKGLGVAPDHASAVVWYERAAKQGYGPAQINLGQLYETGKGVPMDPQLAMTWFRRAAGIEDLDVEFVSFVGDAKQFDSLRDDLAAKGRQVGQLRGEVATLNQQLGEVIEQRASVSESVGSELRDLEALREQLASDERELAERTSTLEAEEQALETERAKLAKKGADRAELETLAVTLAEQRRELDTYAVAVRAREQEVDTREAEIAQRSVELDELDTKIQKIDGKNEAALAQYAQVIQPALATPIAGPSIQLVDPELVLTRSAAGPSLYVSAKERAVIGRVDAPGGLLSLVVNDVEAKVDGEGFFESKVRVRRTGTQVRIVAIDQQGKRSSRSFVLRRGTGGPEQMAAAPVPIDASSTGIDFGRYHALVIGNSNYLYLPKLMTSITDARMVAKVFEEQYGFEVTTLIDADRYTILSALNKLREELSEKDNLVVYYAGHGEFDQLNDRGYWMPIEAETENRANWISNQSVTDILNAMLAKHVLVVADSCYSGALTQSAIPRADDELAEDRRTRWRSLVVDKRSRTALTSGGLAPVLDGGEGEHSVFAHAFIDILRKNNDVLDGRKLYEGLAARVTYRARTRSFHQEPQYAPIRFGGHESGDFFLVPSG
jgi:uncharacterized caspase-like protein